MTGPAPTPAQNPSPVPAGPPAPAPSTRTQDHPGIEVHRSPQHMPSDDRPRITEAEPTHPAPRFGEPAPASQPPTRHESLSSARPGPSHLDVVCREERVDVTTEWHVLGTARLRKYVVTEEVERRIPVVRERVRVERVPVSEADLAGMSEEEIAEAVEEVTLREERPVVRKRMVPIERIRLVVERVTHEEVVRTQLRREQVKVHDDGAGNSRPENGSADVQRVMQYNGTGSAQLEQPIA